MRLLTLTLLIVASAQAQPAPPRSIDVSPVWAGHPVGFDLLTAAGRQYIAFYDDQRRMTVGVRRFPSTEFRFVRLPSPLGWDSHNYVTLALDRSGYLHLSGNMHAVPLVYFRSTKPYDIDSFEPLHRMTGSEESRCTYPEFLHGPRGELIFTYRDGRSGSGNQIYNVYDERSRQWRRLLDAPLTDGEGRSNAYFVGPVSGPDGFFHLVWVWRNTPDCSTNHDLSYARSRDLVHWTTSSGRPLPLPIRLAAAEIVDAVPTHGGIINGNTQIGFDSKKRPIISYHKFDEKGFTQIYCARLENGAWKSYQVSEWNYRWDFSGNGAIHSEIRVTPVRLEKGALLLDFDHDRLGSGVWRLDEATLRPLETLSPSRPWSPALAAPSAPGLQVHFLLDKTNPRSFLRWETLPANRDRPRPGPPPPPSALRLYFR